MKRISLRVRFLLMLIVLMIVIFGAITLLIVRQNTYTLRDNLITQSKSFAALATQPIASAYATYKDSGTIRIQQQIANFTDLDPDINHVEIVDINGHSLFTNGSQKSIHISSSAAISLMPTYMRDGKGNIVAIVQPYTELFGIHRYNVVYGISYNTVNKDIQNIVESILGLSATILIVTIIVWYFVINRLFLRPVSNVSRIALLISKGDLEQKLHSNRKDEIGDLANAVDTMASSLKADIDKLKKTDELKSEFLMITSHNLRTPLTIIDGYLDHIKDLNPEAKIQEALNPISNNVARLKSFAEDVLTISTMEAGQMDTTRGPIEMDPLISEITKEFETLVKQKKIHFTSEIKTNAWSNINKYTFRNALWNLLDNAYKFTPESGSIELTAKVKENSIEISLADTGIGIAESEIPQLFTKFHRATGTLTYNYPGTGIGLYISKSIIEQYGGTISVTSKQNEGTIFTISLPIIPPPKAHES